MTNRQEIKKSQERFYIGAFLQWFNHTRRCNFKVISEPDPPEAIISSGKTTRWVEISSAFWNKGYAIDLNSYAAKDEKYRPIAAGPYTNMDNDFAQSFVSAVKNKLEKTSYLPSLEKYGQGYLVIPIYYPWLDKRTIYAMKEAWKIAKIKNLNCFRSVYIAYSSGNEVHFSRWSIK